MRLGQPRRDHVDANAAWREFTGERTHRLPQRRLGRAVNQRVGARSADRGRSHQQHRAAIADPVRQRAGLQQRAAQIEIEMPVDMCGINIAERLERSVTGIQEQPVQPAGRKAGRRLSQRLHRIGIGRIIGDHRCIRQGVARGIDMVRAMAGQQQSCALARKPLGGGQANAGRTAGDEDGCVFESVHMLKLLIDRNNAASADRFARARRREGPLWAAWGRSRPLAEGTAGACHGRHKRLAATASTEWDGLAG